jgi:hypothetical protein
MTYFVIFEPNSGTLYGLSTFESSSFPEQYIKEERQGKLPESLDLWDAASREFTHNKKFLITKLEFLTRFSNTERIQTRQLSSTDPIIDDFMKLLEISQEIDLTNTMVRDGLMYLAYKSV